MNENKLIGILNAKEFIALRASGREDWSSILRPAVVVQSSTALLTGFRLLQERRMHLGIVYDGSRLLGIVTLEDILEEVVGEIYDEDDDGKLRRMLSSQPRHLSGLGRLTSVRKL